MITRRDVVIGVMGPTGTGKSSFIQLITGDKNVRIGHGIDSVTSEVDRFRYFERDGRCVTFVDTPGFDDSREGVTDTDILQKIASFLDADFKGGKKLSGIIYLHRITDPRMGGISNRNLRLFKKLCGDDALKNVVVVTTRWDEIPGNDKEAMGRREDQLMKTKGMFFEPLIAAGGRFLRHDNTFGSACRIMNQLLDNDPIALQIQVEMHDGKKVEDTVAGAELRAEMNKLVEKQTSEMKDTRKEIEKAMAEKNDKLRNELEAERTRLQRDKDKWEAEKKQLAADVNSVKQATAAARKETERKMAQQRDELNRRVREAEEKAEKERKELKGTIDRVSREKNDTGYRLKNLESTKNTMDQNNRTMQARLQVQLDQTRRDREAADRRYQQLLRAGRGY
ncbi:P-loop containing nucleoside triphosphate hydrolase protein [Amanita rubescens]|nr:P-loop containing nucleoside triphosphate hydrolase protein [Amanita rubescens]